MILFVDEFDGFIMIKEEYKFSTVPQKIIGCAIKVHHTFGNGFQEKISQSALAIEMNNQSLHILREMELAIFYEVITIGIWHVDFIVGSNNGGTKSAD